MSYWLSKATFQLFFMEVSRKMLTFANMNIMLSLGSNTQAEQNIERAQALLRVFLPDISYGEAIWTEPYPTPLVPHPTKKYLNCLAEADTSLQQEQLVCKFKEVERAMGDSHENHQKGRVLIDIDLLSYNGRTIKDKFW